MFERRTGDGRRMKQRKDAAAENKCEGGGAGIKALHCRKEAHCTSNTHT